MIPLSIALSSSHIDVQKELGCHTNAFNLSFLMVNVSHRLLRDLRCHQPEAGVLDLKTFFRSRRYVIEVIKTLAESHK